MKEQVTIKRWSRRLLPTGGSAKMTIPYDIMQVWGIGNRGELIIYQINDALLVVPLNQVMERGEPHLLKAITNHLNKMERSRKCTA